MKILLASDHGGFELKNKIKNYLIDSGVPVEDCGPETFDPSDDYPDYVLKAVNILKQDSKNKAILICRNGVGVSMLANKFKGVRATLSTTPKHAMSARNDDDANVLAIPADYVACEEAIDITKAWLGTEFSKEERFTRRLNKISNLGS